MKHLVKILSGLLVMTSIGMSAASPSNRDLNGYAQVKELLSNPIFNPEKSGNIHFSTDDITDPLERENLRIQMRSPYSSFNSLANTADEDEPLYTVTCIFEGEKEMPYIAIYHPGYFQESKMDIWFEKYDLGEDLHTYYFQVPEGVYDVALNYYSYVEGKVGFADLVHENVEVAGDITVIFNESELTEKVVIKPLLKDGTPSLLPLITYLDEEPWVKIDDSEATADFLYYTSSFFREGCDPIEYSMSVANYTESRDKEKVFLSNKLSDKYHLVFQCFIKTMDGEIQISTSDMCGAENGEINNYIKDFVRFEVPAFSSTPLSKESEPVSSSFLVEGRGWINNVQQLGGGIYITNPNPEIFVTTQPTCNKLDLKTPVVLSKVEAEIVEDDGFIQRANMVCLPSFYNGTEWEYVNQNHSECGNYSYQVPIENGPIVEYPGLPSYSYSFDEITEPIGNSSPIMVLMSQLNKYGDISLFTFRPQAFIGRFGEVRNCDSWMLETKVNLNGEPVFNSETDGYLDSWCYNNSTDGHEKGIIEASFKDNNVLVDDIPGFNFTTIKFDERNEDSFTPTLQMLIFKNDRGSITDRFAKPEDGVVEFSAGDFNYVKTETRWYYECDEVEIKVEYAPYGEDCFSELDVEEIPENYYMPGFGYFYRGSLEKVDIPSANGWYDLRFTLSDRAGNQMVQHVSPAFKIDSNVSVSEKTINGIKVWSANGEIHTSGSDTARMELFSADGKLLGSTNSNHLSYSQFTGVGFVRVTSNEGAVSIHKLLL